MTPYEIGHMLGMKKRAVLEGGPSLVPAPAPKPVEPAPPPMSSTESSYFRPWATWLKSIKFPTGKVLTTKRAPVPFSRARTPATEYINFREPTPAVQLVQK